MRFGLAGNPNCGKTTLFNALTGSNAHVGNWAGVTVERKEGPLLFTKGKDILIDLPGIYSLSPYSPEERIARSFLLEETPDLIINILDAAHLERSLYLTTQLLELDCPVVVALNMADLLEKRGEAIDCRALSKLLGVEVVLISAARKEGLPALARALTEAVGKPRRGKSILADSVMRRAFMQAEEQLCGTVVVHKTFHAVKALENDPVFMKSSAIRAKAEAFSVIRQRFLSETGYQDVEAAAADLRYRFITERAVPAVRRKTGRRQEETSERVDRLLTHKYWGIPIFFVMMFLVFHLTFGDSLFGTGIPAPGVFLKEGMEILADLASQGAGRLLARLGASPWAFGFVQDAMIGGVFAVLSFLPQILCLFLFLSIMEDSGYMARAAFLMDRAFRSFGLTGKAFLPLLMGFGCSVPAMLAARTLETEKARRMTILLVPFMSCGAKLPIYALFGAALFGQRSEFAVFGMYLIGLLTAVSAAFVLSRTVFWKEEAPFLMELPAYHMPRAGTLFALLWEKLSDYVVRAGTLILAASMVVWFCSHFDFSLHMVAANARESILGGIGSFLAPFFAPLGFAEGPEGWKAVVSVLSGLVAKEAVVSTLGVLYGGGGNVLPAIGQAFTPLSALSFMAFNLLSIPCMAAVSTMHTEMRSFQWTVAALLFWVGTAFFICTAIYQAGCFLGLS